MSRAQRKEAEPYGEGMDAYSGRRSLASNPYRKGSRNAQSWIDGYSAAMAADVPRIAEQSDHPAESPK